MIFFWQFGPKQPFFARKRVKRPPGARWDPQDDKNYFFELPGYENPMVEKRIFDLSAIEKKLV